MPEDPKPKQEPRITSTEATPCRIILPSYPPKPLTEFNPKSPIGYYYTTHAMDMKDLFNPEVAKTMQENCEQQFKAMLDQIKATRIPCARCNSSIDSNCAWPLPNQPVANRYCWICYNTLINFQEDSQS